MAEVRRNSRVDAHLQTVGLSLDEMPEEDRSRALGIMGADIRNYLAEHGGVAARVGFLATLEAQTGWEYPDLASAMTFQQALGNVAYDPLTYAYTLTPHFE